jgi:hypothetical protein
MDGSLMYLLAHHGLPTAIGLSTALMNRILDLPWILLGGLFYALERNEPGSGAPVGVAPAKGGTGTPPDDTVSAMPGSPVKQ